MSLPDRSRRTCRSEWIVSIRRPQSAFVTTIYIDINPIRSTTGRSRGKQGDKNEAIIFSLPVLDLPYRYLKQLIYKLWKMKVFGLLLTQVEISRMRFWGPDWAPLYFRAQIEVFEKLLVEKLTYVYSSWGLGGWWLNASVHVKGTYRTRRILASRNWRRQLSCTRSMRRRTCWYHHSRLYVCYR